MLFKNIFLEVLEGVWGNFATFAVRQIRTEQREEAFKKFPQTFSSTNPNLKTA